MFFQCPGVEDQVPTFGEVVGSDRCMAGSTRRHGYLGSDKLIDV